MTYNPASPFPVSKQRVAAPAGARDNSASLAVGLAVFMTLIIAVSVAMNSNIIALASIPVFIIAVLSFVGKDTTTSIAFYLAYAALEGMFKYMSGFSQAVYVVKPLLAVAILVGWLLARRTSGEPLNRLPLALVIFLFMLWGLFAVCNPLGSGVVSGIITLSVWYVVPVGFYIIGYNARLSKQQVISLLYILVAVSTVVSAFAFLQYAMGREWTLAHVPGYNNLKLAQWIGHDNTGQEVVSFRPASTTAAEGFGTLWSNMGVVASLALMLFPSVSPSRKGVLLTCLLVNMSGLIVSGVRLYVLISIFQVLLMFILTGNSMRTLRRNLVLSLIVGGLAWIGFGAAQNISQGAITSRYAETMANPYAKYSQERQGGVVGQSAWLIGFLTDHPFGIGYQRGIEGKGGTEDKNPNKIAMNRETQFAAMGDDMGIPGLAMFSWVVVAMLVHGYGAFRRIKGVQMKTLAAALLIALVGYTIGYWGGQMLVALGDYIWLFFGLLLALPSLERRERTAAPEVAQ